MNNMDAAIITKERINNMIGYELDDYGDDINEPRMPIEHLPWIGDKMYRLRLKMTTDIIKMDMELSLMEEDLEEKKEILRELEGELSRIKTQREEQ
jgi:hypothetical protein